MSLFSWSKSSTTCARRRIAVRSVEEESACVVWCGKKREGMVMWRGLQFERGMTLRLPAFHRERGFRGRGREGERATLAAPFSLTNSV